ncbi:hypothetical protein [Streptomyces coelicoflavus]
MLRQFREQIDAQFGTAPEPQGPERSDGPPAVGGLNLSALRGEQDSPAQQAALALLLAASRVGTGASAIARALSEEHGTSRQTVVSWLRDGVKDGTAVRVGEGTKARYLHRQHAPEQPPEGWAEKGVGATGLYVRPELDAGDLLHPPPIAASPSRSPSGQATQ